MNINAQVHPSFNPCCSSVWPAICFIKQGHAYCNIQWRELRAVLPGYRRRDPKYQSLGPHGCSRGSESSEMGNVTSRHLQSSGSLDWKYLIKETLLYIFVQYSTDGYGRYILTRCHGCSGVASKLQILECLDPDNHPAEKSGDFYFVGQKWYYVTMDVSVKYTYIFGVIACVDPDLTYCYQNGELSYKSISFTPSFSPYILGSLIGVLLVSLS